MNLRHVSVLPTLRDLWTRPRDMTRFAAYVEQVRAGPDGDIWGALVPANPMAREPMIAYLDALEDFGADDVVEAACREAQRKLAASPLDTRVSLVPVDDVGGLWSDRATVEFDDRFQLRTATRKSPKDLRALTGLVFASETPTPEMVRARVLAAVYRAAHRLRHGPARTLHAMLLQEGRALAFAGVAHDPGVDVEKVRRILGANAAETVHGALFAILSGDDAAARLGHAPKGIPPGAAYAVALADALAAKDPPASFV